MALQILPNAIPEEAVDLLDYDAETGVVCWKVRRGRKAPGDVAGTIGKRGYRVIEIAQRPYTAHRIIWFLQTGDQPPAEIDHINRDRTDNRWANLRGATRGLNAANTGMRSDNSTGFRGVYFIKDGRSKPWVAYANASGRRTHIGTYATALEASIAAYTFRRSVFGVYAPCP